MKVKIHYHHTDLAGVVYYANYLKFLEEARAEFFEKSNLSIRKLLDQGTSFVVARQEIDYISPAFYGDILNIDTRISNSSRVKIEFEYEIKNQNNITVSTAKTILVCVNSKLKPAPLPDLVIERMLKPAETFAG